MTNPFVTNVPLVRKGLGKAGLKRKLQDFIERTKVVPRSPVIMGPNINNISQEIATVWHNDQ